MTEITTKNEMPPEHVMEIDGAIQQAFRDRNWQLVGILGGGMSASVLYRILVADIDCVARVSQPDDQHVNLAREYKVMLLASEAGIAPPVYFVDENAGISLMKFITAENLFAQNLTAPPQVKKLANFVRKLHSLPDFPPDNPIFSKVDQVFAWMKPDFRESALVQEAMALKAKLVPQLSDPADWVTSHCDLNPNNLLYADDRFWLIDWEAASSQNRYFDLASCGNFFYFYDRGVELALLTDYFERKPSKDEVRKYFLMRRFVSVYYGMMFLYIAGIMGATCLSIDEIANSPSHSEMMTGIESGVENMNNPQTLQKMGFAYLKMALAEFA